MNLKLFIAFSRQLYKSVGGNIVIASLLTLLLAVIQGTGILLLFPLLELIGISNTGQQSKFSQELYQWFNYFNLSPSLLLIMVIFIVVVSVRELLTLLQSVLHANIQQSMTMKLRLDLFAAVTYLDWLYFCRSKPAIFMQALITDISRISIGTQSLITLLTTSILTISYLVIALAISWEMTVIVILCGLISAVLLRQSFRKAGQLGLRQTEMNNALFTMLSEHFNALRLTKAHAAQQQSVNLFNKQTDGMKRLFINSLFNQAQIRTRFNLVSAVIFCFFLWVAVKGIMLSNSNLLVLIVIFSRVIPQASNIWQNYNRLCQIAPAYAAYDHLLENCRNQQEKRFTDSSAHVGLRWEIRFVDVDFHYRRGTTDVLKALNFNIKAGEFVAIVGPSGAGKSTILDLILGLLRPVRGEVRVDDMNLADCNVKAWLRNISYVPQNTFLFNDTIRANLLWAKPDATEQEIQQCIHDASLESMIKKLPDGLETLVGERGVCLSGGERQRLAFARALLRKSEILILDEPTSELDHISQYKIQQTIERLRAHTTIIMISHRLETIKNADRILVLDHGAITYTGSWTDLSKHEHDNVRQLLNVGW